MATSRSTSPAASMTGNTRKRVAAEVTVHGRKKARGADPWMTIGRGLARMYNAYDPAGLTMDVGIEVALTIEDSRGDPSGEVYVPDESERRMYLTWQVIEKHFNNKCPEALSDVGVAAEKTRMIDLGVSKACSDDQYSVKNAIVNWLTYGDGETRLLPKNKTGRGFNHPATGKLLLPVDEVWSPELQRKILDGEVQFTGEEWPKFMFKDGIQHDDDPWRGFTQTEYMVKGMRHIFLSPSSVDSETADSATPRKGNAKLHNMTSVTIGSIAYVAAQLNFALSSRTTFSRSDSKKSNDFEGFYCSVYDLLSDPAEEDNVAELIRWWNRQIFPGSMRTRTRSAKATRAKFSAARMRAHGQD